MLEPHHPPFKNGSGVNSATKIVQKNDICKKNRPFERFFLIYNSQFTKGFWSLVQHFKTRTDPSVCTKATRTLCYLIIVNC